MRRIVRVLIRRFDNIPLPCLPLRRSRSSPPHQSVGPLALWHGGLELLRAADWPLCCASGPFRPQASEQGEGPGGKGWFHREPDQPKAPCPFREAGAGKGAEKMNTYEIVTDKIIKLLEQKSSHGAGRGAQLGCRATS
jgi:hypothetical protein